MTLTERDLNVFTSARVIADTSELPRSEWLKLRRSGLGGSDAAAVLGLSKWTSPYSLWVDKVAGSSDDGSTTRLRAGQFLEPFVISEAMRKEPALVVDTAPYMLGHPDHHELFVDVDGFALLSDRRSRGGFEAKTAEAMMADEWADGVPPHYETQVYHSFAVTGLAWWSVAVLIGFSRIETYVVERDDEIIEALTAAELEWWKRHVIEGEPPMVDGSKATTDALSLIQARTGTAVTLTDVEYVDIESLFRQLAHDQAVVAEASEGIDTTKNRLRERMGESTELLAPGGETLATWRASKTGSRSLRTTPGLSLIAAAESKSSPDLRTTLGLADSTEKATV